MRKSPYINGLAASAYIILLVAIMTWGMGGPNTPDPYFAPVIAISVFTLSAAIMGYLFCVTPIFLYGEGQKKAAIEFFLKTTATFAAITILQLVLLFLDVLP